MLANVARDISCPVQVQVVRAQRRPDGYWYTGCVFQGPLETAELHGLL